MSMYYAMLLASSTVSLLSILWTLSALLRCSFGAANVIKLKHWVKNNEEGQLVERSLPKPEIGGSNPDIGNIIYSQLYRKKEIKEKRGREWPNSFFKKE